MSTPATSLSGVEKTSSYRAARSSAFHGAEIPGEGLVELISDEVQGIRGRAPEAKGL